MVEQRRGAAESVAGAGSERDSLDTRVVGRASKGTELTRGTTLERYVILERIAAGGMGVVYAAYDPALDRKVALKLLRLDKSGSEERQRLRLFREAQAMAKLSHPNVLPVHDVGSFDDQIFIATEFVDGHTLKDWLVAERRPWQTVLEAVIRAGRGLAAAHSAGLIHRDFKPANILIGTDGQIRVMDFGLARRITDDDAHDLPANDLQTEESTAQSLLDSELTVAGAALGTPAYMSPEQHAGVEVDARSDQFSFCIVLYEALYGERPFAGDRAQLAYAAAHQPVRLPKTPRIPTHMGKALLRGLAKRPEERWPTMDALLAVLGRNPVRRWTVATAAATSLGVAITAGVAYGNHLEAEARICSGAETRLEGVWDAATKDAVRRTVLATNVSYARDVWTKVEELLDDYADRWTVARHQACEATQLRKEQSVELMDLRMACLDKRLWELRGLTEKLVHPDEELLLNAISAAAGLPPVEHCADQKRLRAEVAPPDDAIVDAVNAVRRRIAEVQALVQLGRYAQAVELGNQVLGETEHLDYAPAVAEAAYLLALAERQTGKLKSAADHLRRAAWVAEGSRMDELTVRARGGLITIAGYDEAAAEDLDFWAEHAQAALQRLGDPPQLRISIRSAHGSALNQLGKYEKALEVLQGAMNLIAEISDYGVETDPRRRTESASMLGELHNAIGNTHNYLGRYQTAQAHYLESIRWLGAAFGKNHPHVGTTMSNLGMMLVNHGKDRGAQDMLERALAVFEHSVGKDHPHYVATTVKLANVAEIQRQFDRAIRLYEEAEASYDRIFGQAHPLTFQAIESLGQARELDGDLVGARTDYERALTMARSLVGEDHPRVGMLLQRLGWLDVQEDKLASGLPLMRKGVELKSAALGANHPAMVESWVELAEGERRMGNLDRSLAHLEGALSSYEAQPTRVDVRGRVEFGLARTLWDLGQRARAHEMAEKARADLTEGGSWALMYVEELDEWAQVHPSP